MHYKTYQYVFVSISFSTLMAHISNYICIRY